MTDKNTITFDAVHQCIGGLRWRIEDAIGDETVVISTECAKQTLEVLEALALVTPDTATEAAMATEAEAPDTWYEQANLIGDVAVYCRKCGFREECETTDDIPDHCRSCRESELDEKSPL